MGTTTTGMWPEFIDFVKPSAPVDIKTTYNSAGYKSERPSKDKFYRERYGHRHDAPKRNNELDYFKRVSSERSREILKLESDLRRLNNEKLGMIKRSSDRQRQIEAAVDLLLDYGQVDGAHHKAWVIDQVLKVLTGSNYDSAISSYTEDGTYPWDEGIAP